MLNQWSSFSWKYEALFSVVEQFFVIYIPFVHPPLEITAVVSVSSYVKV